MGRTETPVDPSKGPLQRFAHDLQVLRRRAGEPPYRTMARRVGLSATVLSQAAKGDRLPTLQTTLAFIRACGGDAAAERHWQDRWEQVREELHRRQSPAVTLAPPPAPPTAPDAEAAGGSGSGGAGVGPDSTAPGDAVPAVPVAAAEGTNAGDAADGGLPQPGEVAPAAGRPARRGLWMSWPLIAGLVAISAALGGAGSALIVGSGKAAPDRTSAAPVRLPPRHIRDGADPYMNGCRPDQQPLERQPIYRANGAFYGWVILFYSPTCAGAWGYVVGPNSPHWTVRVSAHRLDDNVEAPSGFRGTARPNSWGNAMSTLHGCVRAEAWIDTGPRAVTSCFNEVGPVQNARGPVISSSGHGHK